MDRRLENGKVHGGSTANTFWKTLFHNICFEEKLCRERFKKTGLQHAMLCYRSEKKYTCNARLFALCGSRFVFATNLGWKSYFYNIIIRVPFRSYYFAAFHESSTNMKNSSGNEVYSVRKCICVYFFFCSTRDLWNRITRIIILFCNVYYIIICDYIYSIVQATGCCSSNK